MTPLTLSIKDAAAYAGLSQQAFNKYIRPHVEVRPFGPKVLRVLRVDVDRAVASHFGRGSLGDTPHLREDKKCLKAKDRLDSENVTVSGTATACTKVSAFGAALERRTGSRRKRS